MFDGKKIVRSVVALVSAVAMLAGLSFVAPSALAANNLSCAQGTIYGINSGNDRTIYSINTTTGATAKVPSGGLGNSANGLGINKDGSAAYAVEQNPGTVSGGGGHGGGGSTVTYPDSVKILKYDATAQPTPSSASVGTIDLQSKVTGLVSAYLVGGAVSPFNDIFYFGGWTSNAKFALYGWDTAKDQSIGLLGYITADTNPSLLANANGDLAFDASGNLYLVNSLGDPSKTKTPQQIEVRIPAASVPTAAVTSDITATQVAKGTEAVDFNGVAYDGSGTFYMSTTSAIVPGFGNKAINFTGGLSTVDLASCSLPAPPTAHDATVPANSDGSATLTPDVTPGASPITSGSFDNGQTSKKVDGQGTWNITVDPDGKPTVTFTPEDGFTGTPDSQTYTVADKNGLTSDPANLTVTKPAPQDPPTTGNASKAINPNQTATLNPVTTPGSGDITDVKFVAPADGKGSLSADGKTLTVPNEGTWTIKLDDKGQPVATFAPDKDYSGPVTEQQYTVTDSNDKTATGKLDVTINEPPTASDKSATTNPKTPVTLDPETGFGTSQTFTGVAFDKSGATTKTVPGEGTWTITLNDKGQPEAVFTPVDGFTGKTTPVPYIVTDGNGLTATANLDVTVLAPPSTGDASKAINPNETATLNPKTVPGSGDITDVKFVAPADGKGSLSADGKTLVVPNEGTWSIKLDDKGQPVATFAPDKDYSGPVTEQQYTVTDANKLTATGKLDVTINEPPTASDKSATTNPKTPVTLDPGTAFGTSKKFTGVAFDDKGATSKTVPGEGSWTIKLDDKGQPEAVFTPVDGFTGKTAPVPYIVTDGNGLTATANLDVTVLAPPSTGDASKAINPNQTATLTPKTVPGSGDITDVKFVAPADGKGSLSADGKTLVVPNEGTWSIKLDNGQPVATFAPDKDYSGPVTEQQYTVTDSNKLTATGKLDVTVNTPPTTGDKSATTNPKTPMTLAPKTTPGSSPITSVVFDNGQPTKDVPNEGTWTIKLDNGQPVAVFTPADGFTGKTTPQQYTVTDENGLTAKANLDVTVLAPPTTGDASKTIDPNQTATLNPAAKPGSGDITAVAFDNGKDTKTVPGEGSWSIKLDNGQPVATFTPDKDYSGKVTPQSYTVTDANKLTADGTLNVTINPPAPVPPKTGDKTVTAEPGAPVTLNPAATPGSSPITSVAFDNGKDTKVVPGQGTWTVELKDGQPVVTFTPEPGFKGSPDSQKYTVTDGNGKTADGTLTINVPAAPVTLPTTGDKSATTDPGKPVTLAPVAKPGSAPIKSVAFDNGQPTKDVPGEGTWTIELKDGQPVATFAPIDGFTGKTTPQQYMVKDENGKTADGTLTVTISAPPATGDQSTTAKPGAPVTLKPVTKPGSAPITSVVFDNGQPKKDVPGQGTWTVELKDGQPVVTFTPEPGFKGSPDSQKYTVKDKNGKTADGTLTIDVPALTPPTTGDKSAATDPGAPVTLAPTAKPGSAPIRSAVFDNGKTSKTVPGEGTWTIKVVDGQPVAVFAPAEGFTGKTTPQKYTVKDENGLTADGSLDVTVNTPPAAGDKTVTGEPGAPVTLTPTAKPGTAPIVSAVFDNGQPTKVVPGQGTWTIELKDGQPVVAFTPEPGFKGSPDPQQYTVKDGNGKTAEGTLTINVPAAPVPPKTGDKTATAKPGQPVTLAPTAKPGSAPIKSAVFDNGKTVKEVPGEGVWTIKVVDGQPVATFAPAKGFSGKATSQKYTVKDENGKTATGTLGVDVPAAPAAPGKVAPAPAAPAKPAKQPQSILASTGASVGIVLIAMLALAAAGLGLRKLSRRNDSD